MQKLQLIQGFSALGDYLESFVNIKDDNTDLLSNHELSNIMQLAKSKNSWFTIENQKHAINEWAKSLQKNNLEKWTENYSFTNEQKTIGVIAAGNIPMVGFHDLISVLLSGNKIQLKLSSKDDILIPFMVDLLIKFSPEIKNRIKIVERLKKYEAVIATGSDNTARYFESYFSHVPHIIRKNRTSIAVLNGNETKEEMDFLAQDILQYFGLGCRNVTKVFVPENYDLNQIFNALFSWKDVINHHKYANNYDYYRAIYLMKNVDFLENGFFMIKRDEGLFSPISVLFYDTYKDKSDLDFKLKQNQEKTQCVVGNLQNAIPLGQAQTPNLWDYADGVDTMRWLETMNKIL